MQLGHNRERLSWSCKFSYEVAEEEFDGVQMFAIKGVSKEELDSNGAISGKTVLCFDSSSSAVASYSLNGSSDGAIL